MRRQCLGMVCVWLMAISVHAQRYIEISGEIEIKDYRGGVSTNSFVRWWQTLTNGFGAKPRTNHFICVTGTNEWRIDNDFLRNGQQMWYFDGTNVYQSYGDKLLFNEERRRRLAKTGLVTPPSEARMPNHQISIWPSPGGDPLGDIGVNIPWLAFCSGTYLKRAGRLVPLPCEILQHTRDRFAYSDRAKTFNDNFGLPRSVDLFLSKELFVKSEHDFDLQYDFGSRYTAYTERIAPTLDEGARMFHYEVTGATNVLGWSIPTRFEFFQNGRRFEENGDWFTRGMCVVKSVRATDKPEGLFASGFQQTIIDWRFRDESNKEGAILYHSTNAFVSPTNDPALQILVQQKIEKMRSVNLRSGPGN